MADKMQRPSCPRCGIGTPIFTSSCIVCCSINDSIASLMKELVDRCEDLHKLKSLHADIIDQGRKVQIADSGESKYGAMSDSDFIEWMLNLLEGKCRE